MINKFSRLSLVYQLSLVVLLITSSAFVVMITMVSRQTSADFEKKIEAELTKEVDLVAIMFEQYQATLIDNTNRLGELFFGMFPGKLTLDSSRTVRVGQHDGPVMLYDGERINLNFEKPDRFTQLTQGNATVFARYGEDFLRVSTSLTKENGERAVGTTLGRQHPGYQLLVNGKAYMGPARLFGRDYMTKYIPLKDDSGMVFGILYVGFDYTVGLAGLKQKLSSIKFGDTGYPYMFNIKEGPNQGEILMHPSLEGKNILQLKDARGRNIFQELDRGQEGGDLLQRDWAKLVYSWPNPAQGGKETEKIVIVKRIKGWDWAVAAGSFLDEFTKEGVALRNKLMLFSVLGALTIIVMIILALRKLLSPLHPIGDGLLALGRGDLTTHLSVNVSDADTDNEIQRLALRVNDMSANLRKLFSDIMQSVHILTSSSETLGLTTKRTQEGVAKQQTETDQVAAAINEMAVTVQKVAGNTELAADASKQADETAIQGEKAVGEVVQAIEGLAKEVNDAAGVIGEVEKESDHIDTVLEVIRGIADQTNLLALNAAIEAARAGDQGRGFAVVADEVRTLAQRTQQSTEEIQQMIEHLQQSAKSAVRGMRGGSEKAVISVEKANAAGKALKAIASSVSNITDMTTQIASATVQQSAVAEDINHNVISIRDISRESAKGALDAAAATENLRDVARDLDLAVGKFRV